MRFETFSWVETTSLVRGHASKAGSLTGLAFVLLVAGGPVAEGADAAEGSAGWSTAHMASAHRKAEPLKAPQMIIGDASTTLTEPPETIPTFSQRTWESGTYSGPGKRSKLGHGPGAAGKSRSTPPSASRSNRRLSR